jgi:hypothetical protein
MLYYFKTFADGESRMYKEQYNDLEFADFYVPFSGKLRSDNRWVKLSKLIPWEKIEKQYAKNFSNLGNTGLPVRVALGAFIIKVRLKLTDEETVEQIRENTYLQYFIGYSEFMDKAPFDPSVFVDIRKRFPENIVGDINELTIAHNLKIEDNNDDDDSEVSNKGKLLVDATCAPADISFPTDIKLLNSAREKLEDIIDTLHHPFVGVEEKPRTYRKVAAKRYTAIKKRKKWPNPLRRKFIRYQLNCVERNLDSIDKILQYSNLYLLSKAQYKNLFVIQTVFDQQKEMYDERKHQVSDRIVSISQPHVRPIKRGKAKAQTEFGAKLSIALIDGFAYLDRVSFDSYNEAGDLMEQIEEYKRRKGYYPESVHADKIYRNRENLKYCKSKGIRLSGPPLGRPPKDKQKNEDLRKQAYEDECSRVPVEGKFGQAKRRFILGLIMAKLDVTSKSMIAMCIMVLNLEKLLKEAFFVHFLLRIIFGINELFRKCTKVPDRKLKVFG